MFKNQNSSMIRGKLRKIMVLPPFWRDKTPMVIGGQIGFLRLFAMHKKSFCRKNKTLALSEPKLENSNFTAVLAGYNANGGQTGFLRLFVPH